jgi:phage terminase small subunit
MSALNERQQKFVMALIHYPGITQAEAARQAGYSDHLEAAKVRGHYLAHSPAVQAAMREEAGKVLNSSSLMAANVLLSLLTDEGVEPKDRIKAAGMLLDRSGFGAQQTINVNKTTSDQTGKAIMDRIAALAAKHGLDPGRLIAGPAPAVEVEFSVVKDG